MWVLTGPGAPSGVVSSTTSSAANTCPASSARVAPSSSAARSLRAALDLDPSHVRANNDLAWLLASSGSELDRALELAQTAVRLGRSADTLDTLGFVHLKRGDAEDAVTILTKALEARPDSPSLEYHLGAALAAKGDKEQARAMLTKALSRAGFPEAEAAKAELARLQSS